MSAGIAQAMFIFFDSGLSGAGTILLIYFILQDQYCIIGIIYVYMFIMLIVLLLLLFMYLIFDHRLSGGILYY